MREAAAAAAAAATAAAKEAYENDEEMQQLLKANPVYRARGSVPTRLLDLPSSDQRAVLQVEAAAARITKAVARLVHGVYSHRRAFAHRVAKAEEAGYKVCAGAGRGSVLRGSGSQGVLQELRLAGNSMGNAQIMAVAAALGGAQSTLQVLR